MSQLEEKIKKLEAIRPEKEFVASTKADIMGGEKSFVFPWAMVRRGAFLVIPFLAAAGLILGWNVYNFNVRYPRISSADLVSLEAASKDLQRVEIDLARVIESVGRIKEPEQALRIRDEVASTVEDAEKLVETSREVAEAPRSSRTDTKVFSIMNGVGYSAENIEKEARELEESYVMRQKEIAREEIEELEQRSLTKEQERALQEAKDLYNKGQFEGALQKVLEIQSY